MNMMMKGALLVLVLAFSATLFEQGHAADDSFADSRWGFRRSPWRRHWPAFPPFPAHDFKPPEEVTKCAGAFKAAAVCLKPPIGAECCTALQTIQADCAGVKFGHFNPALLDPVLKAHCSSDATPAPPSDATPAPPADDAPAPPSNDAPAPPSGDASAPPN
ncbi:putative membrane lipoprotein [Corchorus capsularis]|uniref:Putative membrane lipoprotein n=1 Tax=Corchorus capsularis TaxID=210143 RepID=A0A1R3I6I7_COCAP|nr:putative membrane lipoprotein [Corchorus capsularis]